VIDNLRIALVICYIGGILWDAVVAQEPSANSWKYILGYAILNFALRVAERIQNWWLWRTHIRGIRALGPEERHAYLQRIWLSRTRMELTDRVAAEGEVEIDGNVERFPFSRGAHRAMSAAFWISAILSGALQIGLIAFAHQIPRAAGWIMLASAILLAVFAAWARMRAQQMETVLEINPFGIAEVQPGGDRRSIRWNDSLQLRGRPRRRRLELSAEGRPGLD